jgi:hypothetical protein
MRRPNASSFHAGKAIERDHFQHVVLPAMRFLPGLDDQASCCSQRGGENDEGEGICMAGYGIRRRK